MTMEVKKTIGNGFCEVLYFLFNENMDLVRTYKQVFYWDEK